MALLYKLSAHIFFFDREWDTPEGCKKAKQDIESQFEWIKIVPQMFNEMRGIVEKY